MARPLRFVSRALLAAIFVAGGANQLKSPGYLAQTTEKAVEKYGLGGLGLPDGATLVKLNGAGMVAGGAALALGIMPKAAAGLLAALLVPTNVVGHPFWEETDPGAKFQERNEFVSNVAIIGGLLAVIASDE